MCLLVESIRIENGRVYNIRFHNRRFQESRRALFGVEDKIDLRRHIRVPAHLKTGRVKCRIEYDAHIQKVEFVPYSVRTIKTAGIVHADEIRYPHKFVDRVALTHLRNRAASEDEILIIRDGLLTDGYFYNIVLKKGSALYTPAQPLLPGVMRAALIDRKKIEPKALTLEDVLAADEILFINALTKLGEIRIRPDALTDCRS